MRKVSLSSYKQIKSAFKKNDRVVFDVQIGSSTLIQLMDNEIFISNVSYEDRENYRMPSQGRVKQNIVPFQDNGGIEYGTMIEEEEHAILSQKNNKDNNNKTGFQKIDFNAANM